MQQPKVLIIEPDGSVAQALVMELAQAGYETLCSNNGRDGIRRFLEQRPQAVILRDAMPGMDGWDTARRIREMSTVPLIFISDRNEVFSMERALHVGDDYVTPPWNWARMVAKLSALLRRQRDGANETLTYDDGHLSIDFARRQVVCGGKAIHLTDTEFKLLSCFVRHPNQVLTYDELLTQVWGHTHFGAKSHVSLYVRYLRKKLEDNPARPVYFNTEWGVGYSFRPKENHVETTG